MGNATTLETSTNGPSSRIWSFEPDFWTYVEKKKKKSKQKITINIMIS